MKFLMRMVHRDCNDAILYIREQVIQDDDSIQKAMRRNAKFIDCALNGKDCWKSCKVEIEIKPMAKDEAS